VCYSVIALSAALLCIWYIRKTIVNFSTAGTPVLAATLTWAFTAVTVAFMIHSIVYFSARRNRDERASKEHRSPFISASQNSESIPYTLTFF
jgi:hypothetical protein